jgi:hypothetical protein
MKAIRPDQFSVVLALTVWALTFFIWFAQLYVSSRSRGNFNSLYFHVLQAAEGLRAAIADGTCCRQMAPISIEIHEIMPAGQ